MANIKLARVDDRLIHGQVMTAWVQNTGATHIIIIDDATANDSFLTSIITMAVPNNIELDIFTVDEAVEYLNDNDSTKPVILLAKYPDAFLEVVNRGVELEEVTLGGMGARKDRTQLHKNLSASEQERKDIKELMDKGVNVKIHVIPDQSAVSLDGII